MLKKFDRAIKVQEGIEAIAHRVFQLEVAADNIHGLLIIAHAALQADKRVHQLRLLRLELPVGVRIGGVNHGAGGQHEGQRFQGVIRIELSTAGHAGRVIGHHAANGAGRLTRRIRAELAVAQAQPSINLAHRRTRLDAHALALIQYLDAAEVLAHVHQVTIARGLAGKGRAARAQGYRNILLSARTEDGGHVLGGASLDDCLGGVQVVRGIGGMRHAVNNLGFYLHPVAVRKFFHINDTGSHVPQPAFPEK